MHRAVALAFVLLSLQACSGKSQQPDAAAAAEGPTAQTSRMAVQSSINLEVDEPKVAGLYDTGQTACSKAAADACALLESRLTTGNSSTAYFKFRAKPEGIRKLLAAFEAQGKTTGRSTTSEDLSAPIVDTEKKLAMLNDYRSKLQGLLGRASTDVDALIKVNRELAQVQSELEAMSSTQAKLAQRVETQILVVTIATAGNPSSSRIVSDAVSEFGANLARGTSSAVTGVAYLLPWSLPILVFVWAGRRLLRWRRRAQRPA